MQATDSSAEQGSRAQNHWRDRIKVHPAADLFPMMSDVELDVLGADITANGLHQGITLWTAATRGSYHKDQKDDKEGPLEYLQRTGQTIHLVDGRNRIAARERQPHGDLEDKCPTVEEMFCLGDYHFGDAMQGDATLLWGDTDPYAYVISANIHRRHLTVKKRKQLAIDLAKAKPEMSNRQIAEQVKLSHPTVAKVRAEAEATGDVEKVSTSRTDTKGRQQPAHKPAMPKPKPAVEPSPSPATESAQDDPQPSPAPSSPSATAPKPLTLNPKKVEIVSGMANALNLLEWRKFWDWAVEHNEKMGQPVDAATVDARP